MSRDIATEVADDGVATLTLARPERRNALSIKLRNEITEQLLAAVNGAAVGGGMDLCVLCDFRIASDTAIFGHPEIKFGAPPLFTPLQWIVGVGLARDLCLTGRRIDASEAMRIGLVNSISQPAGVLDDALALARTIIEAPQATLEFTKRYLISSPSATFEEAFAVEHDAVFDEFLGGPLGPRTNS